MSDPISIQPKINGRRFEEIVVEYPHPDVCTYPEFRGKPYFSIKYTENGDHFVGYGTYKPEVLSSYLKEYFIPSAQPEIIRCKDCKYRDPEDKKCDCGHDIIWQLPRGDDWYCADAERRTDGTTKNMENVRHGRRPE